MTLKLINELDKIVNDVHKVQIILNEKKKDFDTTARERLYSEMFGRSEEKTKKLYEEETKKLINFYTAKRYYLRSIKSLGKNYGTIIGIDLGTTYSRVGIFKNGQLEIIANDQGNRMTPSYIAFTPEGEQLIGDAAKNQLISNPENTVFDVKRLIGREFNDPSVQRDIKSFPFKVIEKNSRPIIQINIAKEQKLFTPEEISAMILRKMREIAEAYLGEKVTHAVITVPAYFNDAQRQATKDAAIISGLNVIHLIHEPTAAAIFTFDLYRKKHEKKDENEHTKKILVLHLGGGTFDVSFIQHDSDRVLEVLATNGYTNLGGKDFDQRVMEYFIELFKNKTGKDVRKDNRAVQKLRHEIEKVKQILSSQDQAKIEIESFFDNEDFSETLTRAKFEELNMDLFHLIMELVKKPFEDTCKSTINGILLVGGSTYIPKVQQLVKEFYFGRELVCGVDIDEAVVYGATIQAGFLSGEENASNIVLLDLNPSAMSIETEDGHVTQIIQCNTVIPTKKTKVFSTAIDNQPTITIQVFEGKSQMAKDNHLLGKFDLTGIPPAPRGVPQIEVTFEIDVNGILKVTAEDKGTGNTNNIVINSNTNRLSSEEIDRMIKDSERFADEDKKAKEHVDAKNELESYAYSLKTQLNDKEKLGGKLSSDDKESIEKAVEEQIKWLESNPSAEVDELKEHKKQLEEIVTAIMTKLY